MSDPSTKTLVEKLRGSGKEDLIDIADCLDFATDGFFADPPTVSVQKFVGTWAKARRLWCEHSGQIWPLVEPLE